MSQRSAIATSVTALALAIGGCGLGPGKAPTGVSLVVTRDFGAQVLRESGAPRVAGQETVMRVLLRNDTVTTRFGGGFVQSIDGLAGGQEGARPVDWFYYVNGIQAPKGAADTVVHPGDHIWWDRHDWGAAIAVPAVVGSFPEPFLNGLDGKRLPVTIECAAPGSDPCTTVSARLRAAGVPVAYGAAVPTDEPHTLHVLVGPWTALHANPSIASIERGPQTSGVYARISPDGRKLSLLDPRARARRVLTADAGLIAATRYAGSPPVWVVTGVDAAGVDAAAHAFDEATLDDRFAVAIDAGAPQPLPMQP